MANNWIFGVLKCKIRLVVFSRFSGVGQLENNAGKTIILLIRSNVACVQTCNYFLRDVCTQATYNCNALDLMFNDLSWKLCWRSLSFLNWKKIKMYNYLLSCIHYYAMWQLRFNNKMQSSLNRLNLETSKEQAQVKRGQTKKKPTKSRIIATQLVLKDIEWPDQLFLAQSLPLKKGPHICT